MMVWIGSGDGGVTVAAGQSHCGSGLPSESGLAAATVTVADGSDVHARRETLNGRKKVCVRVGSDNAPFESGPATVADSLCQEREQGCEGISEPL
jgi:hypothetical protein